MDDLSFLEGILSAKKTQARQQERFVLLSDSNWFEQPKSQLALHSIVVVVVVVVVVLVVAAAAVVVAAAAAACSLPPLDEMFQNQAVVDAHRAAVRLPFEL